MPQVQFIAKSIQHATMLLYQYSHVL